MMKEKSKVNLIPGTIISKRKMRSLTLSFSDYPHGVGKYQNHIFKDNIPGYPGYYISRKGKLYSRWDINGKGILRKRFHKKTLTLKNRRYHVKLSQPGIGTTRWQVSRLVALVYLPNPDSKPYVCHKDNNPLNNSVDNLYWGTQKENMEQASRDGRFPNRKGIIKKGTDIQRSYIPRLKEAGFSYKEISEILNISSVRIRDYYNGYRNLIYGTNYYVHNRYDNDE